MVIDEIRANPTYTVGWFNFNLREARRWIFPLTPLSARLGILPLSNPVWGAMKNPWWSYLTDVPEIEEERVCLGDHPSDLPNSDVVCSWSGDKPLRKKNAGGTTNHNQLHGQPVCCKDHTSVLANHNLQLTCDSRGEEDGGVGSLHKDDAWNRADNGIHEENMMEFDGGVEASTSHQ